MPKRLAICIGINRSAHLQNRQLSYAASDAEALHKIISDKQRGDFDSTLLLNEKAEKDKILKTINSLLQDPNLGSDDIVLIYFSGHGGLDSANDLFLVAHDTLPLEKKGEVFINLQTAVHIKELEISLQNTNAGSVVMIVDTCHSGSSCKLLSRIKSHARTNLVVLGSAGETETAKENLDLQHGVFTESLLRALNNKPDEGEWITLEQIIRFTYDEMRRVYPNQSIEVASHVVNPRIPIAKNPLYTHVSPAFVESVKQKFLIGRGEIEQYAPDRSNFFIVRSTGDLIPVRIGVLCLFNSTAAIDESAVRNFVAICKKLRQDNKIDQGCLVTSKDIEPSLREIVQSSFTKWVTEEQLVQGLMDFSVYMKKLINDFEVKDEEHPFHPPLSKYYVDLVAEARRWRKNTTYKGRIDEIISAWLDHGNEHRLIIFGEYGSGKSTFCKKLAHDMAIAYKSADDKTACRIPILIPLRDFPRGRADLEALVISHLSRRCEIPNPNWRAFNAMNENGFLLLIFDGFDEMSIRSRNEVAGRNLQEIVKLSQPSKSKVIVTSRPEYFFSATEEDELVEPLSEYIQQKGFRRLTLLPFELAQVEEFLRHRIPLIEGVKNDWKYYRDEIKQHGLSDFSSKPVLLEMIVKTLPKLVESNQHISRPLLYQTYITEEIRRKTIEDGLELLFGLEDRFRLMQILATELFEKKLTSGLSAIQIMDLLKSHLTEKQRDELEAHLSDFLTFSLLARNESFFRFSYNTIKEYLVARTVYDEMQQQEPDIFKDSKLTYEIIDHIIEMKPNLNVLWSWVRSQTPGYTGTNALTILHRAGSSFRKKNLSDSNLHEADIRGINLVGANLSSSSLRNADLQGAMLNEAVLFSTDLHRANLSQANLFKAQMRKANLSEANLEGSMLSGANLKGANLESANLAGATLVDVEFDGGTNTKHIRLRKYAELRVLDISRDFSEHIERQDLIGVTKLKEELHANREIFMIKCSACYFTFIYKHWLFGKLPKTYLGKKYINMISDRYAKQLPDICPGCGKEISIGHLIISENQKEITCYV